MNLFAVFFALFINHTNAESLRVDFLDTPEEVIKDFCRTGRPNTYGDCGSNYRQKMVTVYVPESLGRIFSSQISEALDKRYYDDISHNDLFHAHLFLKGPQTNYSPLEYFNAVTANLFHSAEYNFRWENERKAGISIENRRPRSFMGWLDGHVQNAFELFPEDYEFSRSYSSAGTIYPNEIQAIRPDLSSHTIHSNRYPDIFVTVCKGQDCRTCEIDNQLLIVSEPSGRFLTQQGQRVDFYLRCFYPRN